MKFIFINIGCCGGKQINVADFIIKITPNERAIEVEANKLFAQDGLYLRK